MRIQFRYPAAALVAIIFTLLAAHPASAQQRLSDRDVEALMKNLKQDTKPFVSTFTSAMSKSNVRKTTQEKIYKALAKTFQQQVDEMLSGFQSKHSVDATLPALLQSAHQIDDVFIDVQLEGSARPDWIKCKTSLSRIAAQFNIAYN
jgi:preprotein translocase subunit SecA